MNQYKVKGHIGEGAHGYVMKAINLTTNQEVALKKLSLKSLNEGIPNNVLREIKALQQIDCEYVCKNNSISVKLYYNNYIYRSYN